MIVGASSSNNGNSLTNLLMIAVASLGNDVDSAGLLCDEGDAGLDGAGVWRNDEGCSDGSGINGVGIFWPVQRISDGPMSSWDKPWLHREVATSPVHPRCRTKKGASLLACLSSPKSAKSIMAADRTD